MAGRGDERSAKKARASEREAYLAMLRAHGRVVESETADVELGPGQTHVLVRKPGAVGGELVEKRKSLIRR
jgi:hypothetical protein